MEAFSVNKQEHVHGRQGNLQDRHTAASTDLGKPLTAIMATGKTTLITLWITEDSPYGLFLVEKLIDPFSEKVKGPDHSGALSVSVFSLICSRCRALVPQGPAVVLGGAPSSSQQPREARARRSFSNPPSGSHLGALGMGWRVGTMLQSVACPAPPYMTVVSPTPQALGQPKVPPCISQSPGETVPARTGVKTWPGSAGRSFQEHFS